MTAVPNPDPRFETRKKDFIIEFKNFPADLFKSYRHEIPYFTVS
jgi:hypothetical protein